MCWRHHDLHRSHHRSRHAAALPVRRHQGTLTLLVIMGISAALGGSAAVVGLAALGGVPDGAGYALTITAVVLWALMPFSLRLTERFYRRGGVDHERHPIVEA